MCIVIYVYIYIYIYVYVYICICIHTLIHTYIYINLFSKRSKCPPRALQGAFYCGDYLDPDDLLEKRVFLFPIFLAMFLSIGETSSSVFYLSNYASFLKSATINSLEAGALTETNHLTLSLRRNEEEVRDVQSTESNCGWLITMTRV